MSRLSRLGFVFLAAVGAASSAPSPSSSPLIQAFRVRVAEVEQIRDPFGVGLASMAGARLVDMAKVDFIASATRPIHPRYLNTYDRKFVLSAVMGLHPEELEAHLPAAMNYVRLATASRLYYYRIRSQELLWGKPKGLKTLADVARRSQEFRQSHLAMIRARTILPSRVLTAENLGDLGDPRLVAAVEQAYEEGRSQFLFQRNSVVFMVFLAQLAISFALAVLFLQRRRPGLRFTLRVD